MEELIPFGFLRGRTRKQQTVDVFFRTQTLFGSNNFQLYSMSS